MGQPGVVPHPTQGLCDEDCLLGKRTQHACEAGRHALDRRSKGRNRSARPRQDP